MWTFCWHFRNDCVTIHLLNYIYQSHFRLIFYNMFCIMHVFSGFSVTRLNHVLCWTLLKWSTQTGLLIYRDWLDSCNFGFSKYMFHTLYAANNKGADQTAQMRCSFMEVVQFKGVILKVKSLYAQKFCRAPVRKRYSVKPTVQHCKLFVIHKDAMVRITACGKMENFPITRQWKTTKKRWKNTKGR